jgi:formylglycine-generating enzyme required for sulfatase activity
LGEGEEAHRIDFLDYDYWLARYPVTNAQYMTFVEDGGYEEEKWWAEAITAGRWEDGEYMGRKEPYDWGAQFGLANLPVVGVSWYEALAFTRWLTARWGTRGWLPPGWRVTLPSEAEWEKAARGGLQIPERPARRAIQATAANLPLSLQPNPAPKRPYTWTAGELTPERANYDESEINQTSSVGAYREAASVYDCEEMLGNVYEWTRSLHEKYPYDPKDGREQLRRGRFDLTILRGYGWSSNSSSVRCASRGGRYPGNDIRVYGFRLVLSPFDSGLW